MKDVTLYTVFGALQRVRFDLQILRSSMLSATFVRLGMFSILFSLFTIPAVTAKWVYRSKAKAILDREPVEKLARILLRVPLRGDEQQERTVKTLAAFLRWMIVAIGASVPVAVSLLKLLSQQK